MIDPPESGRIEPGLRAVRVQTRLLRHRLAVPVRTSFGVMHERPALLVCVHDADGAQGWGEVWCNFPACGAEHRQRLIDTLLAPLLQSRAWSSPREAFAELERATAVLAIQCGEPGPIAQAIAGLDQALWDLVARRAGVPLWRLHGGSSDEIGVYASGIDPAAAAAAIAHCSDEGHRAFKVKIGFDERSDLQHLVRARAAAGRDAALMVDANQAWDLATATRRVAQLRDFDLQWIEEPLRADRPWSQWRALAKRAPAPLAAGENLAGNAAFDALLASRAVGVVQPDIAKWGGWSGTLPVARRVLAAGLRFCPHYLGGGVGLLHAAHLLAATGGGGWLEVDANPNPLRSGLAGPINRVVDGRVRLGSAPGIGIEPDSLLPALGSS